MVHSSFHYHYARLIELLYALEKMEALLADPAILDTHVRSHAAVNRLEGVGMIEAPRGVLIHHYKVDENGAIVWANLIVATGHNNLAINRSVGQVARHFVHGDEIAGRHAEPRLGGGARLRPVPELLHARRWHAGAGDRAEGPGGRGAGPHRLSCLTATVFPMAPFRASFRVADDTPSTAARSTSVAWAFYGKLNGLGLHGIKLSDPVWARPSPKFRHPPTAVHAETLRPRFVFCPV